MKNTRRITAVILTALVLVAVVSSLFAVIHEAHHDCTGENCRICAMIAVCRSTLKAFADALIVTSVFSSLCAAFVLMRFTHTGAYGKTPTALKVKLLN